MTVHRKAVLVAAALAASAALALSGCSGGGGTPADSLDGSQLLTIPREDMGTFDRNFNPFSNPEFPMTQQAIYESMLVYNPADGSTTPWLATEWEVAPDSTGITYQLREGVKWSDGEPFTADDVVLLVRPAAGDPRRLRLHRDRHRGRPAHGEVRLQPAASRPRCSTSGSRSSRRPTSGARSRTPPNSPTRSRSVPVLTPRSPASRPSRSTWGRTPNTGSPRSSRSKASACWHSRATTERTSPPPMATSTGRRSSSRTSRRPTSRRTPTTGSTGSRPRVR